MHNANYYLPLLSPEATQAVLMVAGGIYATREKLSEWPIESKEKPFWLSEAEMGSSLLLTHVR
ncbi:MAG: hypothetical protein JRD93_18300 [Deltaproteobacteria bacterium]|nr:hypothetical protein [Deltaproteobacteria bacterium]